MDKQFVFIPRKVGKA